MCGRYEFVYKEDKLSKLIEERSLLNNLVYKQGEIFPNDNVLCIIGKQDKIDLVSMKWGIQTDRLLINARIESLDNKPFYEDIRNNHCAVICNGFYEWDKDKNKFYIDYDEPFVYLCGVYNDNNELLIVTREADDNFKSIHNRMPVVMNKEEMIKYVHNEKVDIISKEYKYINTDNRQSLF